MSESKLDAVIAAYLESIEAGQPPDQERWLADHPMLADRLREFFTDLAEVEQAVPRAETPGDASRNPGSAITLPSPSKTPSSPPRSPMIGRYKLLQRIGTGGMGEVWLAEQVEPVRRRVALKLIKAGMDSKQVVARFEAERQALALMEHQNIAKVLDAGTTATGRPYFVMELVRGIPITDYCDKNKLTINDRLQLFVSVCQAVQHAHQKGIIHRDIKPSNILVAQYDGRAVPKVIDFGLAKALQHQAKLTERTLFTEHGQVMGTLRYMSPEQAELNALDVDTRTDIYSLGVLLYELLTGSTPIDRDTLRQQALLQVLQTIREQDPPRPSARLSGSGDAIAGISQQRQIDPRRLTEILRGDLDWIVMKTLEKDRTRRYPTASSFAEDIERYLAGAAIEARPPSTRYRIEKFVARNRGLVFSTATIAVLLITGIVVSTWFAYVARIARNVADGATATAQAAEKTADKEKNNAINREAETKAALTKLTEQTKEASAMLFDAGIKEYASGHQEPSADKLVRAWRLRQNSDAMKPRYEPVMIDHLSSGGRSWLRLSDGTRRGITHFSPDGRSLFRASENCVHRWDAQTGVLFRGLMVHESNILKILLSPDGRCLATRTGDNRVQLWDPKTGLSIGVPIAHDQTGHGLNVMRFSPNSKIIATGSTNARLWDAHSGIQVGSEMKHKPYVQCLAFSPDGTQLATAAADQTTRIWDAKTGAPVTEPKTHESFVTHIEFCADGERLVMVSNNAAHLCNAVSSVPLVNTMRHKDIVNSVVFSPDGTRLATASRDETARLWDARTGIALSESMKHEDDVLSVAFSPDGTLLATGSKDNSACLWNGHNGVQIGERIPHENNVSGALFDVHGTRLATETIDGTTRVWELSQLVSSSAPMLHDAGVADVEFSQDSRLVATGSLDNTAQLWNAHTGLPLGKPMRHEAHVYFVTFSPDARRLVTISNVPGGPTARLWDTTTGNSIGKLIKLGRHIPAVSVPDAHCFAVVSDDNCVRFLDFEAATCVGPEIKHDTQVDYIAGNRNGTCLVTSSNGTIQMWNPKSGINIGSPLRPFLVNVYQIAFSPDEKQIATLASATVQFWDTSTCMKVGGTLYHDETVQSMTYSPDNSKFATACDDKMARLWDIQTGQMIGNPMSHDGDVVDIKFSNNGKLLATAARQNSIGLWDVQTGAPMNHKGLCQAVSFSLDNQGLATTSFDGSARIWDIEQFVPSNIDAFVNRFANKPDSTIPADPKFEAELQSFIARKQLRYRASVAIRAVANKDWFAAKFHLPWLCEQEPHEPSWPKMLAEVNAADASEKAADVPK